MFYKTGSRHQSGIARVRREFSDMKQDTNRLASLLPVCYGLPVDVSGYGDRFAIAVAKPVKTATAHLSQAR